MFTGIIEGLGSIGATRPAGQGKRLTVEADYALDQTKIGDSIAVNGACLTVVKISGSTFEVDLSPETLATSTFDKAKQGDRLNLERAMRLSDRIDGHLVLGHVDGIRAGDPFAIHDPQRLDCHRWHQFDHQRLGARKRYGQHYPVYSQINDHWNKTKGGRG
jgi:hypothetical protein